MPTVKEIEAALFELAPREGTMDWDNVGHLLGDPSQKVARCMVALDITHAVAEEAIAAGCQLIVSHHPIMNCKWSQVQTVRDDTFQGSLLTRLLRANVSAICMHTNLDVAEGGVNDILAQALGIRNPERFTNEGVGRCGWRAKPMALPEFVRLVSKALGCGVPVGAFLLAGHVAEASLKPGDHGTTYGGNPFVGAAVRKVLDIFQEQKLTEHVQQVSGYLERKLEQIKETYGFVMERRGLGMMQGIELDPKVPAAKISRLCLEQGLILITAGNNVLRFLPPLVIEEKHVDEMADILQKIFDKYQEKT